MAGFNTITSMPVVISMLFSYNFINWKTWMTKLTTRGPEMNCSIGSEYGKLKGARME
jgi:hypothetical protein